MMKHLNVLRELGPCCIASARRKPVGFGWTEEAFAELSNQGFQLVFRENAHGLTLMQLIGLIYAIFCKAMRLDKAFGHSNPYHRFAFNSDWLYQLSKEYDLFVMQYGFWSRAPTACPKAIIVHELLSNYHWGGHRRETTEFGSANLLLVVGYDEFIDLKKRGLTSVLWSPPAVQEEALPLNDQIGLIGTRAPQNMKGLRWLEQADVKVKVKINVFGNMAGEIRSSICKPVGRYGLQTEPYTQCGIHLLTRPDRPGLQIKAVEALAYGRAIVARRGSMRGLPDKDCAWITVDSPEAMIEAAVDLQRNREKREALARKAKNFYRKYLDHDEIISKLKKAYINISKVF